MSASTSPSRLNRPLYTIDTSDKERRLQRANHVITREVISRRSIVDDKRPGSWVPGVGSVARALRLLKEHKGDAPFQEYVRRYVHYAPINDAKLREMQKQQAEDRAASRPSSAVSRCSFGSGRKHCGAAVRPSSAALARASAHSEGSTNTTNENIRNEPPASPVSNTSMTSSFALFANNGSMALGAGSYQLPPAMQRARSPSSSGSDGIGSSGTRGGAPAAGSIARHQSFLGRRSTDAGAAIVSLLPFKVWMDAGWVQPTTAAATAACATPASKEAKRRCDLPPPPVVDLRRGGAASAMVASAMQQKAAAASAGSPASSALDTSQLLAAATGSSQVVAAGYVPSEYGVTFRAHQHLVMHLPQGEPQTENFSVSSASAASSEDAKPQAGGAAVAEDPAAEERRLLASYGYRGVGGAGTRQRSASERGGSLGGRRATLRL